MDFSETKAKWLEEYGFSAEGKTYIISGDSYSIKDELKAKGFKFDYTLKWHRSYPDDEYADRTIEIDVNDVAEINAYGKGHYKDTAAKFVNEKIAGPQVISTSNWIAAPGDVIKELPVVLSKKSSFIGKFGLTNVINITDNFGNALVWFTTSTPVFKIGDSLILTASVKKNDEYKGTKTTVITRARLKEE